jgi:hypothetical protein
MRHGKVIALTGLATCLLVGVLAWGWKQGRPGGPDMGNAPATGASSASASTPPGIDSSPSAPEAHLPLPALDIPVATLFAELKPRADRGDARAACRLAVELIECNQAAQFAGTNAMQGAASAERDLAAAGMEEAANHIAAMQLRQLESAKRCAGISESQRKLAGTYLAQAASAGVGEAMIRYAEGQGLGTGSSIFGMLRDPGLDQWRRDAPGFLHRALENGEPSAAVILMSAYSDDNSLIGGLIADDPVQFYSYRALMDRLRGKTPGPRTDMTPAQTAEALARGARMHAEYFKNAILTGPDALQSPTAPAWARQDSTPPRRPCE